MESSNAGRKRRGFIKGKFMSFYKPAKLLPSSSTSQSQQYSSSKTTTKKQTGLVGDYVFHRDYSLVSQQLPKRNVSLLLPETTCDSFSQFDNPYGVAVDEGVDIKAANYISAMQERFKLERVNSDRKPMAGPVHQEM